MVVFSEKNLLFYQTLTWTKSQLDVTLYQSFAIGLPSFVIASESEKVSTSL